MMGGSCWLEAFHGLWVLLGMHREAMRLEATAQGVIHPLRSIVIAMPLHIPVSSVPASGQQPL